MADLKSRIAALGNRDPESARLAERARNLLANREEDEASLIPTADGVVDVWKTTLDQFIEDTASLARIDGTTEAKIQHLRAQSKQPERYGMGEKEWVRVDLQNTVDAAMAARMMAATFTGIDGIGGLAGDLALKYGGNWRLGAYEIDTDVSFSTVTKENKMGAATGNLYGKTEIKLSQKPDHVVIRYEMIETTGHPALKYEATTYPKTSDGDQVIQIVMPQEFIDAQREAAEMNRSTQKALQTILTASSPTPPQGLRPAPKPT